jgi:hypothetical protein
MRYLALCCDYDGTLARDGRVDRQTLAGLEKLLASGRRLVLVTGRELPDLQATFPRLACSSASLPKTAPSSIAPPTAERRRLLTLPPGSLSTCSGAAASLRFRSVASSSPPGGRTSTPSWKRSASWGWNYR